MRYLFVFTSLFLVTLFGNENLLEENIKKQIQKEKKYKEEQKFYQGKNFDLDSFEVNEESLENIPEQPDYNDDFDMNNVYD